MDLLYKLEKRLLSTDFKYFIKYLFQGKFNITYSFSYNCKHYINKIENFYNVILDIDNSDNIFDSLENLITEKLMDGDNVIAKYEVDRHWTEKNVSFKDSETLRIRLYNRMKGFLDCEVKLNFEDLQKIPEK